MNSSFSIDSVLKGKSALVIGGSGGIGASVSLGLARCGVELTVHGGRESEKFDLLLEKIFDASGVKPRKIVQELLTSSFDTLETSLLTESARNCDILCVCFGPFVQKPLHETSFSDWKNLSLFDYALPGFLVSSALPSMMKNHFGRILLFGGTGTSHRLEFSTNAAYAGAKSGLNVLVSSVAANYADYGITCNAICPGFVETEYIPESLKGELSSKMPLGSMISLSSVAETSLFLLQNADINGTIVRLDRGWSPSQKSLKFC